MYTGDSSVENGLEHLGIVLARCQCQWYTCTGNHTRNPSQVLIKGDDSELPRFAAADSLRLDCQCTRRQGLPPGATGSTESSAALHETRAGPTHWQAGNILTPARFNFKLPRRHVLPVAVAVKLEGPGNFLKRAASASALRLKQTALTGRLSYY